MAIDFETTGFDSGGANEPWQLGAALVLDGEIAETREWFFKTEIPFSADSRAASAELSLMDQWEQFHPFLAGRRLVAHNTACEKTILTKVAPLTKWGPWTDTLKLAKKRYPKLAGYTLGELCERFGCVPQMAGRTWHDGLYDAVACARLALAMGI